MVTVSRTYQPISSRPLSSSPKMSPSTPIQILPATSADCLAIADIESLAFEPDPATQIMFGPRNIAGLPKRAAQLQELLDVDPTMRLFKAVVDGEIVAAAQWHIRTDPEWQLGKGREKGEGGFVKGIDAPTSWPPGANAPALNDFFGWIYGVRKRRMGGKKHVCTFMFLFYLSGQRKCMLTLSTLSARPPSHQTRLPRQRRRLRTRQAWSRARGRAGASHVA